MLTYPLKLVSERRFATMDFTKQLADIGTGVTLSSCAIAATVYEGTDGNPAAILDGAIQTSGAVAGQWIKAGLSGVVYTIAWTATCSDGSIIVRQRLLSVRTTF